MSVTIYTKNNCQPCRMSKMKMDKDGTVYEEINIETSPEALVTIKELGYLQAPVIVADGEHWSGFNYEKLNALAA